MDNKSEMFDKVFEKVAIYCNNLMKMSINHDIDGLTDLIGGGLAVSDKELKLLHDLEQRVIDRLIEKAEEFAKKRLKMNESNK